MRETVPGEGRVVQFAESLGEFLCAGIRLQYVPFAVQQSVQDEVSLVLVPRGYQRAVQQSFLAQLEALAREVPLELEVVPGHGRLLIGQFAHVLHGTSGPRRSCGRPGRNRTFPFCPAPVAVSG